MGHEIMDTALHDMDGDHNERGEQGQLCLNCFLLYLMKTVLQPCNVIASAPEHSQT